MSRLRTIWFQSQLYVNILYVYRRIFMFCSLWFWNLILKEKGNKTKINSRRKIRLQILPSCILILHTNSMWYISFNMLQYWSILLISISLLNVKKFDSSIRCNSIYNVPIIQINIWFTISSWTYRFGFRCYDY